METILGTTANELWLQAFGVLSTRGHRTQSRSGETTEALHAVFQLTDPRQRWIVSRQPAINPAFAIAELFWMLAGSNDAAVVNYWNRQLPKFAGATQTYPGAYGHRLRRHFGVDQLRRAVDILNANPDSRQVVLQLWDVANDLPNENGKPQTCDVPCNLTSILSLRAGRLNWTQVMRSNDIIRGFPYNIVQFTTLHEILAGWLGVGLGSYHHWSDSLHLYNSDSTKFEANTRRIPELNGESLMISMEHGERLISDLFLRIQRLTDERLTRAALEDLVPLSGVPVGYRSLYAIMVSEAARRRGWFDLMHETERHCMNEQLTQVWRLWKQDRSVAATVRA